VSDAALGASEHALALRASEGHGAAQDWNASLDHALRSAQCGNALAQSSLAGLAGQWTLAGRIAQGDALEADWPAIRNSIDVAELTRSPPTRIMSASPRVALVEGIASAEVCEWLIARARSGLVPAKVYDRVTGGPSHHGVRTNSERHFPFEDRDLLFNFLRCRFAAATGLPVAAMEAPTILHYLPGQEFRPHHDYLDPAASAYAMELAERGQRVLTLLLCLNEDYDGGETAFPMLGRRFKGRKGNALFFWNVEPKGAIDERTLHAGSPPMRGEKWMLSQWIRDREWRDSTAPIR
jgi:prolyl 4-hydroxylase